MNSEFTIETTHLDQLQGILPGWLNGLSMARGQIVVDQIRGVMGRIKGRGRDEEHPLMWFTAIDSAKRHVSVLATQGFLASTGRFGDTATILHAGPIAIESEDKTQDRLCSNSIDTEYQKLSQHLVEQFDRILARRGVRFLQWATDSDATRDASVHQQCESFGMQKLATLEYLSASANDISRNAIDDSGNDLSLIPLDITSLDTLLDGQDCFGDKQVSNQDYENFVSLVQQTYQGTRDCPAINQFRTAKQTLQSYQNVDSFDPKRWYWLKSEREKEVIGCVLMASHGTSTSELVYMALIPEQRGKGLGRATIRLALHEAISRGQKQQIVLAVDHSNTVARRLYHETGLRPLLNETVWGKSIAPI